MPVDDPSQDTQQPPSCTTRERFVLLSTRDDAVDPQLRLHFSHRPPPKAASPPVRARIPNRRSAATVVPRVDYRKLAANDCD